MSPQTADEANRDARRRKEALEARRARDVGDGERRSEGERRERREGVPDRVGHRSKPAALGGGRGGASGRVPVDKWGDPIRREGGGRVDLTERRRERSRSRDGDGDRRRRRDGERREGNGFGASAARGARGRSRSRSREKVRSPTR